MIDYDDDDDNEDVDDDDDDDDYDDGGGDGDDDDVFSKNNFCCRIIRAGASLDWLEVFDSFCFTYSGYGKSSPACTQGGSQPFITSYLPQDSMSYHS